MYLFSAVDTYTKSLLSHPYRAATEKELVEVYLPSLGVKLNTSPWILINLRWSLYLDMLFYSLYGNVSGLNVHVSSLDCYEEHNLKALRDIISGEWNKGRWKRDFMQ